MENFTRYFVRIEHGKWTCVRPGEFQAPNGRIQVAIGTTFTIGTTFMGMDLASLLEDEYQKKNGNANPQVSQIPPGATRDSIRPLPSRE